MAKLSNQQKAARRRWAKVKKKVKMSPFDVVLAALRQEQEDILKSAEDVGLSMDWVESAKIRHEAEQN